MIADINLHLMDNVVSGVYIDRDSTSIRYDDTYFDHYMHLATTSMGTAISTFREGYVTAFAGGSEVLDYGCGYGTIVMQNANWYGYDIMAKAKERLGAKYRIDWESFPTLCFFDVLEHLSQPETIMRNLKSDTLVFISIPLYPGDWDQIAKWRHWKPKEHYLYASPSGFCNLMEHWDFEIIDHNQIETSLGRNDIHTYCIRKR